METQQRIVCQWCKSQNLPVATFCHSCGAPLDVRNLVGGEAVASTPAPLPVDYRRPRIDGDPSWVTVANFQYCGEIHAARALLSRKDIVSRIGPAVEGASDFDLQVASTEAEWAREILTRQIPEAATSSGFPVVTANAAANAAGSQQVRPVPVIPLASGAGPSGAGYHVTMAALWIVMLLIILSMVWLLFH
jgi:hypothetical protein